MSTIEDDAATVDIAIARTLAPAVADEPTRATPVTAVRLRSGASVDLTPIHDGVIGWPHGPRPPRYEAIVAHNLDEIAHAARLLTWTAAGYHALALADAREGLSSHPRVVCAAPAEPAATTSTSAPTPWPWPTRSRTACARATPTRSRCPCPAATTSTWPPCPTPDAPSAP